MNVTSEDIKDWLIGSAGLGYTFKTDMFIGLAPDAPDNIVTIRDTGGLTPEHHITYYRPSIQIEVRNTSLTNAYTAAEAIRDLLRTKFGETINSTRYIGIWQVGDINHIGYDEAERVLLTMNFDIHRTPS